jgi:hypothetical protein
VRWSDHVYITSGTRYFSYLSNFGVIHPVNRCQTSVRSEHCRGPKQTPIRSNWTPLPIDRSPDIGAYQSSRPCADGPHGSEIDLRGRVHFASATFYFSYPSNLSVSNPVNRVTSSL